MGISVNSNCLNPCATVNCVLNGATSSVIRLCHLISSQKLPVSKEQTSGWWLERDWSRSLLAIKVYVAVGVQFFFVIRSISIVCFKAFELVWNGVTQVATWIRNLGVFPPKWSAKTLFTSNLPSPCAQGKHCRGMPWPSAGSSSPFIHRIVEEEFHEKLYVLWECECLTKSQLAYFLGLISGNIPTKYGQTYGTNVPPF